ncbi:MAG: prephenate dehydratase [Rhodoluna sp.]|nr:prephenate dehydratase [Rhodoluna sp.]
MSKPTCLYLGPAGSFCHQAALRLEEDFELKPMANVAEIVAAVEAGEAEFGLVPIENSVDGEVTSTVDSIVFNTTDLLVRDEVVVPVEFDVFVKPGVTSITRVLSHPVALAQCQNYINSNSLTRETSASTSAAVQAVAEGEENDIGAIASPIAGELYGLVPLSRGVQDNAGAHTKFYLLGKSIHARKSGREYRTWVAVIPPTNRTGILGDMLAEFSSRDISLTSLSSRPLRAEIGAYAFNFTVEGHIGDAPVREALEAIIALGSRVRVVGSFPEWEGDGVVGAVIGLVGLGAGAKQSFANNNLDVTVGE